jgi:hypothetical protein
MEGGHFSSYGFGIVGIGKIAKEQDKELPHFHQALR